MWGLISVLIANYNNGRFIEQAIDSIIKQSYKNWEIIIVDDASTDHSLNIIGQYVARGIAIKLEVHSKNLGCGATKRRCVELAQGEICGFLDPDDALLPHALERMFEEHQKHESCSLISSRLFWCDEFLNIQGETRHQRALGSREQYLTCGEFIVTHFATFKIAKYRQTQGIDSKYKRAVDQDLYFKLEEVGDLVFINEALYLYRIHQDGISLLGNRYKAFVWVICAIMDACLRRGLQFEDIVENWMLRQLLPPLKQQCADIYEKKLTGYKARLAEAETKSNEMARAYEQKLMLVYESREYRVDCKWRSIRPIFGKICRLRINFRKGIFRLTLFGVKLLDIAP